MEKELEDFMISESSRAGNPDRTIGFQNLGYKSLVADKLTNELLTWADRSVKRAITNLLIAMGISSTKIMSSFILYT